MIAERLRPEAVAYEIQFDRRRGLNPLYLSSQIDTYIGERLNVLLHKTKYEINNGLIYGENMSDPFAEVIKKGIDYKRKTQGEDRVDRKREEAELEGFLKIQAVMLDPQTPIGTMMLSVSPKGREESLYQHNFYDIFTLKEEKGERFIEARRYSSALTIEEYKDKLKPLKFVDNIYTDADFLRNPIKIDNVFFDNADQIHAYLHREHETIEVEKFEEIMKTCEGLKWEYINNPSPKTLDAIKNKADEKAGFSHYDNTYYSEFIKSKIPLTVDQEIDYYGNREVRKVATGCGSSGSSSKSLFNNSLNISSPFSVSEFGVNETDDLGDREFPCPACGHTNRRPRNETIARCQNRDCPDPTKVACA